MAGVGNPKRPVPDDFHTVAPVTTKYDMALHYSCGNKIINRWLDETGLVAAVPSNVRLSIPDDFRARRISTPMLPLVAHYGVSRDTIRKWSRELGLKPLPRKKAYTGPTPTTAVSDGSLAAQAAHFLRRDYLPVCKCITSNSKADPDLWFVGRAVLSTADMIAKSESRGFGAKVAA